MKKNYQTFTIIFIISLLILYILNSTLIVKSILSYTNLFLTKLFPTSFIIFILASILVDYGIISIIEKLNLNGPITYISLMSLISGFPSGAKYTKELLDQNIISKEVANYLITYTFFPNPIFVLGPVSLILTKSLSIKILISIIISNFIVSKLFKVKEKSPNITNYQYSKNFSISLKKATNNALKTLIIVYSSSLFFYLISIIITKYISFSPLQYVIVNSIFDLTNGIFTTPILSNILIRSLIIIILLSFGSISIHIQIKSIISDTSIKYSYFLFGRIIGTIISSLLLLFFQIL